MIRQVFDIDGYWKVCVFYDVDFSLFSHVVREMGSAGASTQAIREVYDMLRYGEAKAATYNNVEEHVSIVLFNPHTSREDYINSIVHEAEHVKQAILMAYQVEDEGEPPAYTIGYIISQMYRVFAKIICECNETE